MLSFKPCPTPWTRLCPVASRPFLQNPAAHLLHTSLRPCTRQPVLKELYSTSRLTSDAFQLASVHVRQERLMKDIHDTAKFGIGKRWGDALTETGMSRLALSDADKDVRDWFAAQVQSLGCALTVDDMGSHLDTQPTGGRYDGILGVMAGLEMLKVLDDSGLKTKYPVGVVNWTNEEGARFPKSMVSSGVWAQSIPLEEAHSLASVTRGEPSKTTMRTELERIGYLGKTPCSYQAMPMAAHFELHIEQGPILERERQKVGVVVGAQAYRWFTIVVTGRDCHTGTTPLHSRADPLLAAAKMIVEGRLAADELGGVASNGIIDAHPGAINTVPGTVTFTLDIRAETDEKVEVLEQTLRSRFQNIAAGQFRQTPGKDVCEVAWKEEFKSPAVHFNETCISCVQDAAEKVLERKGGKKLVRRMVSGAGHDSVYTNTRVPTSMIFVPSRDGVSHNPVEYTSPEDCALGAQVLLEAILNFDEQRKE